MKPKKTFRELYFEVDNTTPKETWIKRIAKIAMCSEGTVRMWIGGRQKPNPVVQTVIAKELGVAVEGLFPDKKNEE